jgi:hypothetical protein
MGFKIERLADVLEVGNTTGGTDLEVTGGDVIKAAVGADLNLQTQAPHGAGDPGKSIVLTVTNAANGTPGNITLTPGSNIAGDQGVVNSGGALVVSFTDTPVTTAANGSFFISNGDGGLTAGSPYFRPPSSGTPVELGSGDAFMEVVVATNDNVDGVTANKSIGFFEFAPDDYFGGDAVNITLRVVMSCSNVGKTATYKLYNVSDSEYVTASTLTTSSSTPVLLTVPLTVGGAGLIKDASKIYESRIYLSGVLISDVTYVGSVSFRVVKAP